MDHKNNQPITFYVFRKDGSKNPDILRFFLEQQHLTAQDAAEGYLTQADGTKWKLILEEDVRDFLKQSSDPLRCIISFQLRISGCYAVARMWKPSKKDAASIVKESSS